MIHLLFFLSGFCALVYEIAWTRMLSLSLGSTAQASSLVLAVFMAGLAAGSYASGRLASGVSNGLRLYGYLELALSLVAWLVTVALNATPYVAVDIAGRTFLDSYLPYLRWLMSAAMLFIPSMLMGATLPVLVAHVAKIHRRPRGSFGWLYGINTLGAAIGSLCACFYGFAYLGIKATIELTALMNLLVGFAAVLLGRQPEICAGSAGSLPASKPAGSRRSQGSNPVLEPETPACLQTADTTAGAGRVPLMLLCLLGGMSGFYALSYEILWTRLLRYCTTSSTYAFTLMVSVFLLGLAAGSFIATAYLPKLVGARDGAAGLLPEVPSNADRQMLFTRLGFLQILTAGACALSFLMLPAAFLVKDSLVSFLSLLFLEQERQLVAQVLLALFFMLVPATLIGISLPVLGEVAARCQSATRAVGTLYAANTLGCILGALVTGLLLVPLAGTQMAYVLVVAVTMLTGVLALSAGAGGQKGAAFWSRVVLPLMLFCAFAAWLPPAYTERAVAARNYGQIVACLEDANSSVLVLGYPDFRKLVVNGEPYSSTALHGRRYMRLIGHLPVLLHRQPKNVLAVCFGTGTTAGAAALHPQVSRLDLVELSPAVIGAGPLFADSNQNVLNNEKVRCLVDDGRNYLLKSHSRYDVITFEPPPPYDAGVVNLYSREFYQLVRDRLNANGILCQWVPMGLQTEILWKGMIQAAAEVFPEVSVWVPNNREALLIASSGPLQIDFPTLQERIDGAPAVKASLQEVGLGDAYAVLSTHLLSGEALRKYVGDSPAITDDKPQLEFFLPYPVKLVYPVDVERPKSLPLRVLTDSGSGFDKARFNRNLEAMHLLRLANKVLATSGDISAARAYLHASAELLPDNQYLQWAEKNIEAL